MKALHPASTRALTVKAIVILLVGFMIPSPSGAFLAFGLAGLLSALPAIFGRGKIRIVAVVVLLCGIGIATNAYLDFKKRAGGASSANKITMNQPRPSAGNPL